MLDAIGAVVVRHAARAVDVVREQVLLLAHQRSARCRLADRALLLRPARQKSSPDLVPREAHAAVVLGVPDSGRAVLAPDGFDLDPDLLRDEAVHLDAVRVAGAGPWQMRDPRYR